MRPVKPILFSALLLAAAVTPAFAQNGQPVSVRAIASTTLTQQNTGFIMNAPFFAYAETEQNNQPVAGAHAESWSRANIGTLGAYAQAQYGPAPSSVNLPSLAASASASFHDRITIAGPADQSMLLNFTVGMDGDYTISNKNHASVSWLVSFQAAGPRNTVTAGLNFSSILNTINGTPTVSLLVFGGETIRINGNMQVSAIVGGQGSPSGMFSEASYGHTAHFFVDPAVANPALTVVTASGTNLSAAASAAAPEPGAGILAGYGLLIGMFIARRRSVARAVAAAGPEKSGLV